MKKIWRGSLFVMLGFLLVSLGIAAAGTKNFTYKQAFEAGDPEVYNHLPDIIGWFDDTSYLRWQSVDKAAKARIIKVDASSAAETELADFQEILNRFKIKGERTPWAARTADYTRFLIDFENDLYYYSIESKEIKRLTSGEEKEENPDFSPDGSKIAFTRANDLYVLDIASGFEQRLTRDGSESISNGKASWVYYEEIFGRASRYKTFWWSPNGKMISFMRFDDSRVPQFPIFNHDGIHGNLNIQYYPKAGDPNPEVRLGIYHLNEQKITWVDPPVHSDDFYLAWPIWAADSQYLYYQWMNRGQNELRLYRVNNQDGVSKQLYMESEDSWVEFIEDVYVFNDGRGILLRSDRDGWRHLYLYDLKQEQVVRLTEGEWNVQDITCVNENDNRVYFHGSPENSTEKHLLCLDMNDRNLSDLTSDPGSHQAMVSPKGSFIIDSYSSITHPEKMVLAAVNGEVIRELGNRESEKMDSYNFGTVQLFKVPAGDGISLPAMWVLPPQRVTGQKFPVIISVYGGPGSQDVKNSYVSLHDNFYAQNGIIIFRVDHRGTAHFGKVGAKEMHRQLGKWEMHDLIAAVKWLREQPFVDAEKIGIRGTSYGGYVAALALTRGAEYFTYGFSGFPVTDWRLYDSMYTERYMDMPDENPQGYEDASVMNYVEEYNGHLQISHGGVDDNVHVQNTMQLADALLAHLKNFELLIYPNQFHGYRGNYRRHSQRNEVDFWFRHFFNREFELVHEGS